VNLTRRESKLVERLRKQERQWRYTRWLLLAGGLVLVGMWAWVLHYVCVTGERSGDKDWPAVLLALAYPKVLFSMIIAAAMIGLALRDWWGSPTRGLVLRLVDEVQALTAGTGKPAQPAAPPNGGPATQPAKSGVAEGPPSVS
jgi:hypothetical protein